ncbi:alpha-tubulin N-acetyltransferase 1-like isoform X2 [Anneissia japonica]|uniref:alpha-tubulin N-acetyltransferase 1-like isoform X2 n=1 Tax=Anneissia japonica TaxID=1529436 RepID=UPI0014259BCA|nr:alpha-tubulin N-acetyltransferase 1-like isoform X2 [Anneissia japonica]
MEFPFNINYLFGERISMIDNRLMPYKTHGHGNLQSNLITVIDEMGKASAKAQGLHGPITLGVKMRFTDHHLYIMKDPAANKGFGAVLGILKIGRKKLFVLDRYSKQHEMKPMCVLDFYVHESVQRRGCGKQLFQHMLNVEKVKPQHLAIDRPSHKFTQFLIKHYSLRAHISQVNNFVIFEGFFNSQPESSYERKYSIYSKPPLAPNSRASGKQRDTSSQRNNQWSARYTSHSAGSARKKSDLFSDEPPGGSALPAIKRSQSFGSIHAMDPSSNIRSNSPGNISRAYGAQANLYSRYGSNDALSSSDVRKNSGKRNAYSPITGAPLVDNFNLGKREPTPPFGRYTTNHGSNSVHPTKTVLTPLATGTTTDYKHNEIANTMTNEGNYCLTMTKPNKAQSHSPWHAYTAKQQEEVQGIGSVANQHHGPFRLW